MRRVDIDLRTQVVSVVDIELHVQVGGRLSAMLDGAATSSPSMAFSSASSLYFYFYYYSYHYFYDYYYATFYCYYTTLRQVWFFASLGFHFKISFVRALPGRRFVVILGCV